MYYDALVLHCTLHAYFLRQAVVAIDAEARPSDKNMVV